MIRWPGRRKSPPVNIPPFPFPPAPLQVERLHAPKDGLEVEEVDTSAMTETGIHKAWKRLTGQ